MSALRACGMVGPAEAVCRLDRGHENDPATALCCGTDRGGKRRTWRPPIFGATPIVHPAPRADEHLAPTSTSSAPASRARAPQA